MKSNWSMNLQTVLDQSIHRFALETVELQFLPENRFNLDYFYPTLGAYDWLSGQLLYCLIRNEKPVRVIEVAASSGYSSLFSALALKKNGTGRLETFELQPVLAESAQQNFERFGVADVVTLHVGDVRHTAQPLLATRKGSQSKEILFLDGEHTAEFVRVFLDTFLADTHPDSLYHNHDVLPLHAKTQFRPLKFTLPRKTLSWFYHRILRKINSTWPVRDFRRRDTQPVPVDITESSEVRLIHKLASQIRPEAQFYNYDLIDKYPTLAGRQYETSVPAGYKYTFYDMQGQPFEPNASWWVRCGDLAQAYFTKK